jgi:hypothetical protein
VQNVEGPGNPGRREYITISTKLIHIKTHITDSQEKRNVHWLTNDIYTMSKFKII